MTKTELEQCINAYGKDIYSFCRNLTCNTPEADDLYQDTFLTALERCEEIDMEHNPKSYLLSVAVRIWKNKKRKFAWRKRIADARAFVDESDIQTEDTVDSPEQQFLAKEARRQIQCAVARLPEKYKIILLLYYMQELPVAEIAVVTNIPAGTVKSRLYQARKQLEKELEDVLDEKRTR